MEDLKLQKARAAQAELIRTVKVRLTGVGIAKRAGVLGLKVNIVRGEDRAAIPDQVAGVPVLDVEVVGEVRAQTGERTGSGLNS
ncbi:hypothetical protein DES53_111165 [Roseimicrobium gellanilyticum]|uniref:Uncharacterized protein n=1 Tax=Roseimicrobium gellanilyticum TaxID=748857 RepID=A0A366HBU5_9BACT|nr:hypothetical protein DES53_111165 [Roseimicrobium gellanilyticum]